jgi:cation/acetate symporter
MLVAFSGVYVFSITDRSARAAQERSQFDNQLVDCELGMTKQAA